MQRACQKTNVSGYFVLKGRLPRTCAKWHRFRSGQLAGKVCKKVAVPVIATTCPGKIASRLDIFSALGRLGAGRRPARLRRSQDRKNQKKRGAIGSPPLGLIGGCP